MKLFCSRERRRGFTIIELLFATVASVLALGSMLAIFIIGSRTWNNTMIQSRVDQDASYALNRIISDVREAKSFQVLSYGLRVYYPQINDDGTYDKYKQDDSNYVEIYRGDGIGNAMYFGSYLWRAVRGVPDTILARNVSTFQIISNGTGQSMTVTLGTSKEAFHQICQANLTQRVIWLRNF